MRKSAGFYAEWLGMGKKTYPVISHAVANRLMEEERRRAGVLSFFRTAALAIYANLATTVLCSDVPDGPDDEVDSDQITESLLKASINSQHAANVFLQTMGLPPVQISYSQPDSESESEKEHDGTEDQPSTIVLP